MQFCIGVLATEHIGIYPLEYSCLFLLYGQEKTFLKYIIKTAIWEKWFIYRSPNIFSFSSGLEFWKPNNIHSCNTELFLISISLMFFLGIYLITPVLFNFRLSMDNQLQKCGMIANIGEKIYS